MIPIPTLSASRLPVRRVFSCSPITAHSPLSAFRLCFALLLSLCIWSPHSYAQIGGATTAVALKETLKSTLNKAVADGDFLLGKALIDGLTLLEAWEQQNQKLINTAFDRLDGSQQKFFRGIQNAVSEANQGLQSNVERVQSSIDEVYQLASDSLLVKDRLAVLRYTPSVVPVNDNSTEIEIRVIGLGLIDAETSLEINGISRAPASATMQEQLFLFPASAFQTTGKPAFTLGKYHASKGGFFWSKEYNTTLAFRAVPARLGHYKLTITSQVDDRQYSPPRTFTRDFSARNDTVRYAQPVVSGAGWLIDPDSIRLDGVAGESSDGPRLDGVPTGQGFAFSVKCREVKKVTWTKVRIGPIKTKLRPNFYWTGGWQRVRWTWKEYLPIKRTVERVIEGDLVYGTEDLIDLPEADTATVAGTVYTSAGQTFVVDGMSRAGPVVIEILKESRKIAFRGIRL
jgi:hypothetical protein